jgi:tRNA U34 5-methylaminomethyl-2-thiouridine-forming methyltransferase MnmC
MQVRPESSESAIAVIFLPVFPSSILDFSPPGYKNPIPWNNELLATQMSATMTCS